MEGSPEVLVKISRPVVVGVILWTGGGRLWSRSRHTEREEEAGWAKVSHRTTHTYTRERRKTRRPQARVPQGGTQICGGGGASGPRKSHPYMRTRRGGRLPSRSTQGTFSKPCVPRGETCRYGRDATNSIPVNELGLRTTLEAENFPNRGYTIAFYACR